MGRVIGDVVIHNEGLENLIYDYMHELDRFKETDYVSININGDKIGFIDNETSCHCRECTSESQKTIKPGRFIKKLLKEDADVEICSRFTNDLLAFANPGKLKLSVVDAIHIPKYYNEASYCFAYGGTLRTSCMRYDENSISMEVYANIKGLKMIVLLNKDGKLFGRALLWDNVEYDIDEIPDGTKFMDKIYLHNENMIEFFNKYAEENNFVTKKHQSSHHQTSFVYNGCEYESCIKVKTGIPTKGFDKIKYPYLDTLLYLEYKTMTLSNYLATKYKLVLRDTDGDIYYDECEVCGNCGIVDFNYKMSWSSELDCSACSDCREETNE